MQNKKHYYSIKEFSALVGGNPRTIAVNITRAPHLVPRVTRIGRLVRFSHDNITEFFNSNTK